MRTVIGLLMLTAAACGSDSNDLPVGGGGDGGLNPLPDSRLVDSALVDTVTGSDANVATVDANQFVGRVCLLNDPRVFDPNVANVCASTGAGGLTVRLGTASTTTADDGSFTIEGQSGSGLVWRITGPNIVSSFEPLADYFIPAMTKTMYNSMKTAMNVVEVPGEGAMMAFVSRNGNGVTGATGKIVPEAFYKPFYDGATTTAWTQAIGGTGSYGVIWVPGVDVGTATLTGKDSLGEASIAGPIFDGGITFMNLILP